VTASRASRATIRQRRPGASVGIAQPLAEALRLGIVVNNIGEDILRFLPPLVCTSGEIDTLLGVLDDIFAGVMAL